MTTNSAALYHMFPLYHPLTSQLSLHNQLGEWTIALNPVPISIEYKRNNREEKSNKRIPSNN
jgi:hypothetical protein